MSLSQKKLFRSIEKSVEENDNETESDGDDKHCSMSLWTIDIHKFEKYFHEFVVFKFLTAI